MKVSASAEFNPEFITMLRFAPIVMNSLVVLSNPSV
jgi:hypothetical protein